MRPLWRFHQYPLIRGINILGFREVDVECHGEITRGFNKVLMSCLHLHFTAESIGLEEEEEGSL